MTGHNVRVINGKDSCGEAIHSGMFFTIFYQQNGICACQMITHRRAVRHAVTIILDAWHRRNKFGTYFFKVTFWRQLHASPTFRCSNVARNASKSHIILSWSDGCQPSSIIVLPSRPECPSARAELSARSFSMRRLSNDSLLDKFRFSDFEVFFWSKSVSDFCDFFPTSKWTFVAGCPLQDFQIGKADVIV